MTPRTRRADVRRLGAAAALLLTAPLLAACGFSAQTEQVYQPATGTNARSVDSVDILNALIVSAQDGQGTFGGTLSLPDRIKDPVQLVSITDGTLTRPVTVKPGEAVNLAESGRVRLQGSDIVAGRFLPITFSFSDGKTVKMLVPVVDTSGPYSSVPVGSPTPTQKPSSTASPSSSPSDSASPSASDSASGSASPSASPSAG
ncbi:MAG: hypothetical protein ACTHNS_03590 [Marmoricola sp.]